MTTVIYIHGANGSANEAEHYKSLLTNQRVIGFDYKSRTPWDAADEFRTFAENQRKESTTLKVIANSIGAYFAMTTGLDAFIDGAYFISPIVDLEKLIRQMMKLSNVSERELQTRGVIHTEFGEDLSWEYFSYVKNHPIKWSTPTEILYGSEDNLTTAETIKKFAEKIGAGLTIMDGGEHWFHTEEQMKFLDKWLIARI